MPEPTPDVPLAIRGYIVHDALKTDAVLTAGTSWNAYSLSLDETASLNLYTTERTVYLTSEGEQHITFVTADAGLTQRPTNELCLLAGVAELRYHLGVQTYAWENWQPCTAYELERESSSQSVNPRAVRYVGNAMTAIDYDTGDQPLSYLAWRAEQHQQEDYLRQIWGAPTKARCDALANVLRAVDASVRVLYAPYTSRSA